MYQYSTPKGCKLKSLNNIKHKKKKKSLLGQKIRKKVQSHKL